jgi:hypothetical protein
MLAQQLQWLSKVRLTKRLKLLMHPRSLQTVLLDAVDAEAVGADIAAADEGFAGGKPLSEKDSIKRRHVTLMDWGAAPVVEITVSALLCIVAACIEEHGAAGLRTDVSWDWRISCSRVASGHLPGIRMS